MKEKAAALMQESEQMLQTVLDNYPSIVFWKETQSNYLGCKLAFENGAGLNSLAEIVGKIDIEVPWAETQAVKYKTNDFQVMERGHAKLHLVEMYRKALVAACNDYIPKPISSDKLRERLHNYFGK